MKPRALALLLCGCAPPATDAPAPPAVPIIDAHIHSDFTGKPEPTSGIMMTRDRLLTEMRDAGVVGAIAHIGRDGAGDVDLRRHGIVHCAGVGETIDVGRIENGLSSGRYRCIKIYLGYVHRYAADAQYQPVYELAERYAVPVVFHTGDTYSAKGKLKFADPLTVDEVAVDHPGVTFVLAHVGNPWVQSAAEVAYKNPNVYLDGSALLIGDVSKEPRDKVDAYVVAPLRWVFGYLENPNKLMFGSDWPLADIGAYADAFARAIPEEHHRAVFHDNAARVFKLR